MKLIYLPILACFLAFTLQLEAQSTKKAEKYFELRQYDKAIESYKKVLEKTPEDKNAQLQIAECYYVQNKLKDAVSNYEKYINDQDIDSKYIYHYAQALRSLGSTAEAKIWYKILAGKDSIVGNHFLNVTEKYLQKKSEAPTMEVKSEFINTDSKDFAPVFYNNQVVYGSGRTDITNPGMKLKTPSEGKAINRVFITSADQNGYLKPPALLHAEVQDQFNDMPLSFSQDGKWVVFTKGNWENAERPFSFKGEGLSLYIAKVGNGGQWTDIKPLPFNNNQYSNTWPCLTENGMKLYFSSNKPGGSGGYDIYVSQRFGEKWSEPANIGNELNTPGDEISPYLSGNLLYFSSDWVPGIGGFDICQAELQKGKWTNSKALDNGINSSYDDYGFIWDAAKGSGYLTSNRENTKGYDDIYRVKRIGDPYTFIITDMEGKPIPLAIVDMTACGLGILNSNTEGKVNIKTLPKEKCNCSINLEGYEPVTFEVTRDEVFSSKQQKVTLKARTVDFVFKFINKENGNPIMDVNAEVSAQSEQKSENFISDSKGQFKVTLQKDRMYFLKANIENYKPESKLINTTDRNEPVVSILVPLEKLNSKNVDNTASNSEKFYRTKGIYAIQIETVAKNSTVDIKKYENIVPGAQVYKVMENNSTKVRIGNFSTKPDAEKAIAKLESKNIKGGFIVEDSEYANTKPQAIAANDKKASTKELEKPEELKAKTMPVNNEKPKTVLVKNDNPPVEPAKKELPKQEAKKVETIASNTPETTPPPAPIDNFRVRIAAVRDPKFTEDPKLAQLGKILLEPRGEFTAVYIGYFEDQSSASKSLQNAIKAGFKDAYVVKKKDKTWVKAK